MSKNFTIITLGTILRQIKEEGAAKGENWDVPRLFVTRNEASPKNIREALVKLKKENPNATEKDVKFLFPFYRNEENHWRVYSAEEAEDLKNKIKTRRRYV